LPDNGGSEPKFQRQLSSDMRVIRDSFGVFGEPGFLVAIAIIVVFEAAFAGLMLVLTSQ
jgi:hypothetical protein